MALMLCPLLGSRRNQTEPVVNRISEVLLDLLDLPPFPVPLVWNISAGLMNFTVALCSQEH